VSGPARDQPTTWREVFGNTHAVEVEIGPGLGDVLLAYAAAAPATNFFGIEHRPGAAEAIVRRAARRGLDNVRAVTGDARCIVAQLLPDASVSAYHIYFPDPWPKRRHHRRRLSGHVTTAAVRRTLVLGGVVHVASDLRAVVEDLCEALVRAGLERVPDPVPPPGRPITLFERKYARAGAHYARLLRTR
jgi:tRNA (guanine-N7-)-methyltransferase